MGQIPQQIGPYEVLGPLGAGGMGEVYRAHDPRLNRDVAVKILPAEVSRDPQRRQRFEQEARAVAALNHPGIISVYDVGDGWLVTELVEGENLRQSGYTPRQVTDIGAQIADALAAAHEAGIAHRDLKPENVILTADGRTKLLDFGLAKVDPPRAPNATPNAKSPSAQSNDPRPENITTVTNPGSPMGTPGYMSPEQVRGHASDGRSDIFSLGVMLYELLAGHAAFRAESAVEVMHAIVHQDPAPLPETVPAGLRTIVERCLEKKPSQRFQSARDLAFALRAFSNGVATPSPNVGKASNTWWPWAVAALALASAAYFAFQRPPTSPLADYRFHPFAFTRADEHSGVWSPDGESIAYIEQSTDGARLMVQSLDGTSPTELVAQVSGQPGQLSWSADSKRVYFLGVGPRLGGVSSVGREGGVAERVLPNANFFNLSPDGNTLAVWRAAPVGRGASRYSVWLSSPPGADPVEYEPAPFAVPTPFTPVYLRFSPSGRLLYLSMYTDQGAQTWLLPLPTGTPRRIFADIPWNRPVAASWMPDSRHMVISGNAAPAVNEQLWLADVEQETLTRLLAVPDVGQAIPAVSPDGKRVLFSQVLRDRDITELPLDGTSPRTLLSTALPEFGPSWSVKGDQFAFITQRNGTDELWVRSPEGNWERPVVTAKDFPTLQSLMSPAFSPDGTKIAYTALLAAEVRRRSLAISPVGGGTPSVVADGYAPTWSPSGSAIAFLWIRTDGSIPVATLRLGSSDAPLVISPPGALGAPEWSPKGDWIAVPTGRGIELISPDGRARRLIEGMSGGAIVWSKDGSTLYGVTTQALQPTLSSFDLATGKVREIAHYDLSFQPLLENTYTGSIRLTLSPNGESVVSATSTDEADLWILEGLQPAR
jgi:eukaryotic-like serine/threonine-protein kinase